MFDFKLGRHRQRTPEEDERFRRIEEKRKQEQQLYEERQKAIQEEKDAREKERRRELANFPARLSNGLEKSLATPKEHPWMAKLMMLQSQVEAGFLYAIIGTYGCGKSQLAVALAQGVIETENALFIYANSMLDSIKSVFRVENGGSLEDKMRRYLSPMLLVVDEVNRCLSEADVRYLQEVVRDRHDACKATLLISNESKADFQTLVGPRVIDRMRDGHGGIISADWASFRKAY